MERQGAHPRGHGDLRGDEDSAERRKENHPDAPFLLPLPEPSEYNPARVPLTWDQRRSAKVSSPVRESRAGLLKELICLPARQSISPLQVGRSVQLKELGIEKDSVYKVWAPSSSSTRVSPPHLSMGTVAFKVVTMGPKRLPCV